MKKNKDIVVRLAIKINALDLPKTKTQKSFDELFQKETNDIISFFRKSKIIKFDDFEIGMGMKENDIVMHIEFINENKRK